VQTGDTIYSLSYDHADPRSYSTSPAANDLRLVRIAATSSILGQPALWRWGFCRAARIR
jgi:hypothetical protein